MIILDPGRGHLRPWVKDWQEEGAENDLLSAERGDTSMLDPSCRRGRKAFNGRRCTDDKNLIYLRLKKKKKLQAFLKLKGQDFEWRAQCLVGSRPLSFPALWRYVTTWTINALTQMSRNTCCSLLQYNSQAWSNEKLQTRGQALHVLPTGERSTEPACSSWPQHFV